MEILNYIPREKLEFLASESNVDFKAKKLGGNLGYVEGKINGVKLSDEIVSASANYNNPNIFDAKFVNSKNQIKPDAIDGAWLRTTDSEFQILSNVAKQLNLQKNQVYNYTGTIKIVSELPYCGSCSGVVHQFSKMLPNVKIIVVNGAR